MQLLAEIADKLITAETTLTLSIAVSLLSIGLGAFRWWLGVALVMIAALLGNLSTYADLHEPTIGHLVLQEAGGGYVVAQIASTNLPLIGAVISIAAIRRRKLMRGRRLAGACELTCPPKTDPSAMRVP